MPISKNIHKFNFTIEESLVDEMIVVSMWFVQAWQIGFIASWMLLKLSQYITIG